MGGRQKPEGDRQETGDRRLSAVEKDGLVSDDGWYKVLSVDGAERLLASRAGFQLLSPFVCGGCAGGNAG
jgi:hypothetical protein